MRVLSLAVLLLLAGCGPSGPKTYPVSGTVTFDGQPLPTGFITFTPTEGDIGPDSGKVVEGKFEFRAQAGKKLVEINANRPQPGAKVEPSMGAVPFEQYIPEAYNINTTLTAEVTSGGENRFTFDLKSKP
jgi:hypothetical protein